MRSSKMAYFVPLNPYKEKLLKNVIFCDFVKLLLGVLSWFCKYVEVFLGPLEGVLSHRIHLRCVSEPQYTRIFSYKNSDLGSESQSGGENDVVYGGFEMH